MAKLATLRRRWLIQNPMTATYIRSSLICLTLKWTRQSLRAPALPPVARIEANAADGVGVVGGIVTADGAGAMAVGMGRERASLMLDVNRAAMIAAEIARVRSVVRIAPATSVVINRQLHRRGMNADPGGEMIAAEMVPVTVDATMVAAGAGAGAGTVVEVAVAVAVDRSTGGACTTTPMSGANR